LVLSRARAPGAVARFTVGELLANAAWASVLTYSGALLLDSYDLAPAVVALGLGAMAAAMVPGTFLARRHAARATAALLASLTAFQAGAVLVLGAVRPAAAVTLGVLAAMAFVNGWRSMIASALGMDAAPQDRVAAMSMRAAANQFGYLLGAATGGLALAAAGFHASASRSGRCSPRPCSCAHPRSSQKPWRRWAPREPAQRVSSASVSSGRPPVRLRRRRCAAPAWSPRSSAWMISSCCATDRSTRAGSLMYSRS